MISFRQKGDFSKTMQYLQKDRNAAILKVLDRHGQEGVKALASATPIDSGDTANSWSYKVSISGGKSTITFYNSNVNDGVPIAVILQLGHGTGTGGWVEGRDYINPALQPVFDTIVNEAWKEVARV